MSSLNATNRHSATFLAVLISFILFLPNPAKSKSVDPAISSSEVVITILPDSSIKIDGDSTVRKFSASAKSFSLDVKAKANRKFTGGFAWIPVEVHLSLPVQNLSSGEKILDQHMHENLKAERYPVVQMRLLEFDLSDQNIGLVTATGVLTVAGVTKSIQLKASLSMEGSNIKIKGKQRLLMSDFGIQPPKMMMGALTTRDEIDVSFDVTFSQTKNQRTENANE